MVALREHGNDVVVFDQPYNRDVEGPRAVGWEEVESWVATVAAAQGRPLQSQFPGMDDPGRRLDHRLKGLTRLRGVPAGTVRQNRQVRRTTPGRSPDTSTGWPSTRIGTPLTSVWVMPTGASAVSRSPSAGKSRIAAQRARGDRVGVEHDEVGGPCRPRPRRGR